MENSWQYMSVNLNSRVKYKYEGDKWKSSSRDDSNE